MRRYCIAFLFLIAIVNIVQPIVEYREQFTERYDAKKYEALYNRSQYVIPQSNTPISDEQLLSHAGYQYANGLNPVLINSDHPPLGKYIIGWTTLLTGNNRIVMIVFSIGALLLLGLLAWEVKKSMLLVSIVVAFASFDSVLRDQIIYSPILDVIHLFFLLLYMWFFLQWQEKTKIIFLLLAGISLGCVASIKIYYPSFVMIGVSTIYLITTRNSLKTILQFLLFVPLLTFLTYTASYFSFFLHENNFRDFLGTQKWIFLFWSENAIDRWKYFANIIPLVLINQWKVWWGNQQYVQFVHWSILWPIVLIFGFTTAVMITVRSLKEFIRKSNIKKYTPEMLLSLWFLAALAYLCFVPISPRYLMIIFFPGYILMGLTILRLLKIS